jgi:predicted glutamine amidotransferase
MCGLLGMHTTNSFVKFHADEFRQMMVINSFRGAHSTGIVGFDGNKPSIIKATGSPYMLYGYDDTDKFFERFGKFNTVIGHGRYATQGKVNAINQHPFVEGKIVLAHNGVINNFVTLKDKEHSHIEVDSHLACALINEKGALEALPLLHGAYVFIWYNLEEETLNIARNYARPLWLVKNTAETVLYFASEKETLLWNSARNKTSIGEPFEMPAYELWTFPKGELEPIKTKYEIKFTPVATFQNKFNYPENEKRPAYIGEEVTFVPSDYQEFKDGSIHILGECTNKNMTIRAKLPPNVSLETIFKEDTFKCNVQNIYRNADGDWSAWCDNLQSNSLSDETTISVDNWDGTVKRISYRRFKQLCAKGCSWCLNNINQPEEYDSMMIMDTAQGEEVVCPFCKSQDNSMLGVC